jgi:hypothetical protein
MSYRTLLHVSVRVSNHQAILFKKKKKKASDDGSREPKHAAVCDMTLKSCVERHIFVRL